MLVEDQRHHAVLHHSLYLVLCVDTQDILFDLENGGGEHLDDSDLNEDVAKLRCKNCRCWTRSRNPLLPAVSVGMVLRE